MMTIELLQTLSIVAFVLAGVLFLVAVALLFLLEVPKLFGEISGSTAKKAIENIRRQNANDGKNMAVPRPAKPVKTKNTEKPSSSTGRITSKLGKTGRTSQTPVSAPAQPAETSVLQPTASETTVLQPAEKNAPTFVSSSIGETSILSQDTPPVPENQAFSGGSLTVDAEMGFLGSDFIIE